MPTHDITIDILLVDDHALCRDGLRYILQTNPSFRVTGEAGDGPSATEVAAATRPDVVLLDADMAGTHVTTTVRQVRELVPSCNIIVLSFEENTSLLRELLNLGVRGYLLKSIGWEQLAAAVISVSTDPLRVVLSVSPATVTGTPATEPDRLSPREREVLTLTALAMSNGQIARRLTLTEATVKRHLHNVFRKLDAVSRLDAVNKARRLGLIGTEPLVPGGTGQLQAARVG